MGSQGSRNTSVICASATQTSNTPTNSTSAQLCGGQNLLLLPGESKWRLQYELVEKPIVLHAHEVFAYWCGDCEELHYAEFPINLRKGGLVGARLSALIGSLKGGCHASYSTIRSLLSASLSAAECSPRLSRKSARRSKRRTPRLSGVFLRNFDSTSMRQATKRTAGSRGPGSKRRQAGGEAANLAERFRVHGKAYFTFITEPDIEPTNNVAEQGASILRNRPTHHSRNSWR